MCYPVNNETLDCKEYNIDKTSSEQKKYIVDGGTITATYDPLLVGTYNGDRKITWRMTQTAWFKQGG